MQTAIAQRLGTTSQQGGRASRQKVQHLAAFKGFRRGGAVDAMGSSSSPSTLHDLVAKQVRGAGASSSRSKTLRTQMMFERFTEKAIK